MRYLSFRDLQAKLGGRGRTTICHDVETGRLSKPVKIGSRLYWREDDIDAAIENLAGWPSPSHAQSHGRWAGISVAGMIRHRPGDLLLQKDTGHEHSFERANTAKKDLIRTATAMPEEANAGPPPHVPRLIVNDGTVEKTGVIAAAQPKGVLQFRDELAGWLLSMESRNGGSDRVFWLEAYGGRAFTVERMSRAPLSIERLTIGALGGIQPDRLNDLLRKARDDGLVARFLPIWPAPAPVRRPTRFAEDAIADAAWRKLLALDMPPDEHGAPRPWYSASDADAAALMDQWRDQCRAWEQDAACLLLSHIGKLPGLAARLALVLASIDHGFDGAPQPSGITANHFGRACHLVETYTLPMARRCYGAASVSAAERAAHRLLSVIRGERWATFTSRDVMRPERALLGTEAKLAPAIRALEESDCIRATTTPPGPRGGRPQKAFDVNPALLETRT